MNALNCNLSRRWFEEAWNERLSATIDEVLAPDCVGHMEVGDVPGAEAFKQVRSQFLGAFPDLKFEIEGVVSDEDDVVVRWRATGTHSGEGLGLEPTNQPIDVRGMTWHRYKDGLMVEGWDSWNQEWLLQRLREGSETDRTLRIARQGELAARIRQIREEVCGEQGGPEMARRLNLSVRAWYNYETGVTIPAEVLLKFIKQTNANPHWLETGEGPKYRGDAGPGHSVMEILRTALAKLEQAAREDEEARKGQST